MRMRSQAVCCAVFAGLLGRNLLAFDCSECLGGQVTGLMIDMAEVGWLLCIWGAVVASLRQRAAAAFVLAAALLALPFYFYLLFPECFEGSWKENGRRPWRQTSFGTRERRQARSPC